MDNQRSYYWVIGIVSCLCLFGLVMVVSSSQIIAYDYYKDSLYFFKRHFLSLLLGVAGCYLFSRLDYHRLEKWTFPLMGATAVLLGIVFLPGIGKSAFGSSRWIPLGFMNLQPSELAKITAVIFTAYVLKFKKGKIKSLDDFKPFIIIALLAGVVLIQPDMGTAALIIGTVFTCLFVFGASMEYVFGLGGAGFVIALLAISLSGYRRERFFAFLDPWNDPKGKGFQIIQSLLGLGSGGFFGTGLGLSKQKFLFLPAAYTDFIVAVIGEELGFLGTAALSAGFFIFAFCGFAVASSAKDYYGKVLAAGITIMVVSQAALNLAAAVGFLPITGVPLPLISYGGSSMLFTLSSIGILLNIAKQGKSVRKRAVS